MRNTPQADIEHYLRTGEHDLMFPVWPGKNLIDRCTNGGAALRAALVATVRERTPHAKLPAPLHNMDVVASTREKVAPMVRGLFPPDEQEVALGILARSVIFLTPDNIEAVLTETPWLATVWDLANLYLACFDAQLLSGKARPILGLSQETTCYVSTDYFHSNGRFEDFVVHEAAHIFHNCKRERVGLRVNRGREWLLEIDYRKRELFAYGCEAFSCILEQSKGRAGRLALLSELENGHMPPDDGVDAHEYIDVLREAVDARNGWKRILDRCAAPPPTRRVRAIVV